MTLALSFRITRLVPPALALLAAACASTGIGSGPDRAVRTASTAERLSEDVTHVGGELGAMSAAIETLRDSVGAKGLLNREKVAKGDIPGAFDGYQKTLSSIRSAGKRVESTHERLQSDHLAYMQSWDASMARVQNESLRRASLARREKVEGDFKRVSEDFTKVWRSFHDYQTQLSELELALGNDLTPLGIDAVDGLLAGTRDRGESVRKDLTRVSTGLADFAATLNAPRPEPKPAPTAAIKVSKEPTP